MTVDRTNERTDLCTACLSACLSGKGEKKRSNSSERSQSIEWFTTVHNATDNVLAVHTGLLSHIVTKMRTRLEKSFERDIKL